MKSINRIIAFLLTAILFITMSMPAFAEEILSATEEETTSSDSENTIHLVLNIPIVLSLFVEKKQFSSFTHSLNLFSTFPYPGITPNHLLDSCLQTACTIIFLFSALFWNTLINLSTNTTLYHCCK